jgi:hypothetical protein
MAISAGVTEIPDSEDEPITSSPADDPPDKLLPTPQHLSQAPQGGPDEAQASAMAGASASCKSLVNDEEIPAMRSPTDTQSINDNFQHQSCPENALTPFESLSKSTPTQTGLSSSRGEPDDPVNERTTDKHNFVEELYVGAPDNLESIFQPLQNAGAKVANQDPDKATLRTAIQTEAQLDFSGLSRDVACDQAISTEEELETSAATPEEPQDGIHVIDFAYFVPEAMPQKNCNRQHAKADAPGEERGTSSSAGTISDAHPTPPRLGTVGMEYPASTSSHGAFVSGSFPPKERDILEPPPSKNATHNIAALPVTSSADEETNDRGTITEIHNTKSREQLHTTPEPTARDTSSTDKAPVSKSATDIPSQISETTSKPDSKTSAKSAQETTLAELKAQRSALVAALAALPNMQEVIAQNAASSDSDEAADSEPTDTQVMAAANKLVKKHIKLLHEYNEIKDVGQGLMGLIADQRGVRIVEVQDEFGIGEKD